MYNIKGDNHYVKFEMGGKDGGGIDEKYVFGLSGRVLKVIPIIVVTIGHVA